MEKKRKKRKLRIGRLFLLIAFIAIISFVCDKYIKINIRNIVIKGNNILSDQEVIEQAKLDDYPSFISTFTFNIKKELLKNPYISSVKVRKGLLSINISLSEKKVLYIDSKTGEKNTLDSKIKDDKILCAPTLTNEVPNEKIAGFKKAMQKIDIDILCQMSAIKYEPNEKIDSDRYLVYMNDGNKVYLTINKFKKINDYNDIIENIGKQNGILYLDYGNYFEAY